MFSILPFYVDSHADSLTGGTINFTKRNFVKFQYSYVTRALKFALAPLILRRLKIALYVYSLAKLAVRSTRFSASVRKFHSSFEITQCPRILVHWGCRLAVFATQVAARLLCLVIRLTSSHHRFSDRCKHWEIA